MSPLYKQCKNGNYAERVGAGAPVYLAAKVLELAGSAARDNKQTFAIGHHQKRRGVEQIVDWSNYR